MRTVLLLTLFFIAGRLAAQRNAESALSTFANNYPQEKVALLYDKENYFAGETVFFKAYVFTGIHLTEISTNLYVEYYNAGRELMQRTIVPLAGGVGTGAFTLKPNLSEGVYYIRAYTAWMLNFDSRLHYAAPLIVYNPSSDSKLVPRSSVPTFEAVPESGSLLAGVENTVALRRFSRGTLSGKFRGWLFKAETPEVPLLPFESFNTEVARISFLPEEGQAYGIRFNDDNGVAYTKMLPAVKKEGVLLRVHTEDSMLVCRVLVQGPRRKGAYKLIAHLQHQLVYTGKINPSSNDGVAKIPLRLLVNGVVQFVLFDDNEQPLAERLAYVEPEKFKSPLVQKDTLSLEPRGYNHWTAFTDSSTGHRLTARISRESNTPKETLVSEAILTSDFGRTIQQPAWYFDPQQAHRIQAWDPLESTCRHASLSIL